MCVPDEVRRGQSDLPDGFVEYLAAARQLHTPRENVPGMARRELEATPGGQRRGYRILPNGHVYRFWGRA